MPQKYNDLIVGDIVDTLNNSGVVILPTDTVYGLAIRLDDEVALDKIYKIKGRDKGKKLAMLVNSFEMLKDHVVIGDDVLKKLSSVFPGPLTLVCKDKRKQADTLAVRMINNELINEVIKHLGKPILITSANKSGDQPISDLEELISAFEGQVDIIIAGNKLKGRPSTILDITSEEFKILREGKISKEEIEKLLHDSN
ncbi:TPA: threonylcarbamoyl-AMP synthase [bacterium]|nr:threonylcarbamoyl-AMP synthase [bacterium]